MSYNCSNDNCVCNQVREIVIAQDEITNQGDGCCSTGCDQSIKSLLSPTVNNNMNGNTTIPFALYCKGSCGPFIGNGVYQATGETNTYFGCIESPIFRAKEFVDDGSCCVRLEILLPATADGTTPGATGDGEGSICPYFPGETITGFQATGICLTVDLNNFHAITCLDPVRPLPASDFPAKD